MYFIMFELSASACFIRSVFLFYNLGVVVVFYLDVRSLSSVNKGKPLFSVIRYFELFFRDTNTYMYCRNLLNHHLSNSFQIQLLMNNRSSL